MISREQAPELIRTEYKRLDSITGINSEKIEIKLSSRLTSRLGYFQADRRHIFAFPKLSITISTRILKSDDLFYDVIRHEYAHAVCYIKQPLQKHGHDKVWKDVCRLVGCSPRATTKVEEYIPVKELPYKYTLRCANCGAESKYKTESKVIKIAEGKTRGEIICRCCRCKEFILRPWNDSQD